jgi:hypothetical protein
VVQTPTLKILRKSSFTASPWKNGGGITHEAMREPPGGGPFRWRVSVAYIDASGPFSDFAGYDRKMVLLKGAGVELRFPVGERKSLRRVGELAEFDGALPAHCELIKGPCVDLNLMVAKSERVAARVERLRGPFAVSAQGGERTLIFAIERGINLETDDGQSATLEPWDLALLCQCRCHLSEVEGAAASPPAPVFLAALDGSTSG